MPDDFRPTELVQVDSRRVLVTEDVVVHPVRVSFAKILGFAPVSWFGRVQALHELTFADKHDVVEFTEGVGSHLGSEEVRPTPDDGIELLDDRRDVVPIELAHFVTESLPYPKFRVLTGADERYPAGFAVFV